MVLHALPRSLKPAFTLGALALIAGCTESTLTIDNDAPAWGDTTAWVIGTQPTVVVGHADPEDGSLIGASDAVRTGSGRIIIAVPGLEQLRVYDPAGLLLFARAGVGAGNFALGNLWLRGADSVAVASSSPARVSWFDENAEPRDVVEFTEHTGNLYLTPLGEFDDGAFLARSLVPGPVLPDEGTLLQDTLAYLRIASDGTQQTLITRMPGPRYLVFDDGNGKRQIPVPFALTASVAVRGDEIVTGNGEVARLDVIDGAGHERARIHWRSARTAITPEIRKRYRDAVIGNAPPPGVADVFDRFVQTAGFPDSIPMFDAILTDDDGFVWLRDYRPPWAAERPSRWTVIDDAGRWLGAIDMPTGFTPTQIGRSYLVGTLDGAPGARQVVMYTLDRSPPSH